MSNPYSNLSNHGECLSEQELLSYLEGTLTPREQHRVEKHLLECALCSDAVDGLSGKDIHQTHVQLESLDQRIHTRIHRGTINRDGLHGFYRIAAIIAVVSVLGGGLYYLQALKKSQKILTEHVEASRDASNTVINSTSSVQPEKKSISPVVKSKTVLKNEPVASVVSDKSAPDKADIRVRKGADQPVGERSPSTVVTAVNSVASPADEAHATASKMMSRSSKSLRSTAPADTELPENNAFSANRQLSTTAPSKIAIATPSVHGKLEYEPGEQIKTGIREYEAAHYTAANDLFQEVLKHDPDNTTALYYSGVSLLKSNNYPEAIRALEPVSKQAASNYSTDAKWYLSQAYIHENKNAAAKKLLDELIRGDSGYKLKAQQTLNELK